MSIASLYRVFIAFRSLKNQAVDLGVAFMSLRQAERLQVASAKWQAARAAGLHEAISLFNEEFLIGRKTNQPTLD